MELVLEDGKVLNPNCSTLLVPALSIGNVGQLAVDLLISSLQAERVGYLDDPSVLPCVGNNAYLPEPEGDLALPLEVYENSSKGLSIIQQRSPVIKGMMIEFAKRLACFAVASGKKHAILLSSLDSGKRKRIDASCKIQFHYISSENADGTDDVCEKLGWNRLEEYNPSQRRWSYLKSLAEDDQVQQDLFEVDDLVDDDYYTGLPFAALYSCLKAKNLKVTCILYYCSEGDNIPDSFNLANAASKFCGLDINETSVENGGWIIPFSWKTIYGPPPDRSLF